MAVFNTIFIFSLVTLSWMPPEIYSVEITSFHVPRGASHEAQMDCRYTLDPNGEKLYDVKWYKDGKNFYKCLASGTVQVFSLQGAKIYHSNIATPGSCSVTLTMLTKEAAGEYTCEVSSDSPDFHVTSKSAFFKILEPSPSRQTQNNSEIIQSQVDLTTEETNMISSGQQRGIPTITFYILFTILTRIGFIK